MKQHDLIKARIVVIVLHMKGCGACTEYLPRFRRIATKYEHCLPVLILDVDQHSDIADKYQVQAIPTTLVLRRPVGQLRYEGALSDQEIEVVFARALRGVTCDAL